MKKDKKDEKLLNTYMREERKLFLGGIAEETTEKDLKKAFSPFGTIMDCKVFFCIFINSFKLWHLKREILILRR